jgi:hypothetical protein
MGNIQEGKCYFKVGHYELSAAAPPFISSRCIGHAAFLLVQDPIGNLFECEFRIFGVNCPVAQLYSIKR